MINRDIYFFVFVLFVGVFFRCIIVFVKFGFFIKKKEEMVMLIGFYGRLFLNIFFKCNKRFIFDGNIFKVLLVI